jgi:UDP-2-acetamido-3-amino-2,3-dideoxy-glucuronate N-acetyltransferase
MKMKNDPRYPGVQIHETALVAADAIGAGTHIWAFCNILAGARIGRQCQICDRVFIENGATLGDFVTIKCGVSIWNGITIKDHVFVGPAVVFTNDRNPRSQRHLAAYPQTVIERYASLGGGSIILPGIHIGRFAMIGAGSVVTRNVADFALAVGNPARRIGWVCVCGERLLEKTPGEFSCKECARLYAYESNGVLTLTRGDEFLTKTV